MSATISDRESLDAKLAALAAPGSWERLWQPELFRLDRAAERAALRGLVDGGRVLAVHDALELQLLELMAIRQPALKNKPAELGALARRHLDGRSASEHGTWVLYPWSGRLVHVLPEAEYRELRSARNQYKITPAEQATLATKRVGVVGLSVGQASAVTMAQEGVGCAFRLADFDTLALSNLNRLRATVDTLGLSKVVIAAREMFGIDPYLEIEIFPDGLTEGNVEAFLVGAGDRPAPLDLLVEECDDLFIKVFARERARAHRIPVVMDTNERGMLDVERFDRDPALPVLHGLLPGVAARDLKSLATRDKVPYVLAILQQETFSERFVPSLMEIDETINSWPQLASGVALGAALTTDVGRRILLGQMSESGRYFVDPEELVRDGQRATLPPAEALDAAISPETLRAPSLPALVPERARTTRAVSPDDVRRLVAHAVEAPSGGNTQPWRFVARGDRLRVYVDEARSSTLLDFQRTGAFVGIGAAVENLDLAARASGLACQVRAFPDEREPTLVAEIALHVPAEPPEPPALAAFLSTRVTNRRYARRQPLAAEHVDALTAAASSAGGRLQLLTAPADLDAIGRVLGGGDRVRFLSQRLHAEMMSEIRWTPEEVERTRDGVDLATLELSRTDLAGVRIARNYTNLRFLMDIGGGRALEKTAKDAIGMSSAVGLITFPGTGHASFFLGGRAMERVWLTATSLGIAFQPWTSLPYLWARLERGGGDGLEPKQIPALHKLRADFLRLFHVAGGESEVMLFRLAHAGPATARALRRPLDEVLTFENLET